MKDLIVVVTGASSGIGRATALAFAGKGATVVLAARRGDALQRAADECGSRGGTAWAAPLDVSDFPAVEDLARRVVDRYGRIDVWVNSAAVNLFGPFLETPLEDFRRVLDVNVMGYVHGARAALPHMLDQGHGLLVNISSIVAAATQPYSTAYGMSKAAVRALSTSLRQELRLKGETGVKVCTVLPVTIDTPIFQHAGDYTGRRVVAMPPVYTPERVAPDRAAGPPAAPRGRGRSGRPGHGAPVPSRPAGSGTGHGSADRPYPPFPRGAGAAFPGDVHAPAEGPGATHGGWHGARRTAVRRAATTAALAGAGAVALRRAARQG